MFFSKSSALAYVVNAIQSNLLTSSEGGSHATPDIVSDDDSLPGLIDDSDDDSLPGLIDDSDSDDDSDVTIRHVRRRLPWRSRVDPSNTLRAEPLLLVLWAITFQVLMRLQPLSTHATATQSKRVEDNLSWVLDSMANVNVACNPELVVHLRATDVAGLRWKKSVPIHFGVTFSSIEVNRTTSSAYITHRFMVFVS